MYEFRIIVAGRITRKERAAFLIKIFNNLPLNKKSAKIDYATGSRSQKFGMVVSSLVTAYLEDEYIKKQP